MRKLIAALLILLLSVAAALALHRLGGLVIITLGSWTLQTSVMFFVLVVIASLALLQALIGVLRSLFGVPGRVSDWRQQRRERKGRARLINGLLRLAEGRGDEAEKLLLKDVDRSEAPLLHYLAAAIAAQHQGSYEQRDVYLARADKSSNKAGLAVGLLQAQLQSESRQWEQALATLNYLNDAFPNHPRVQAMLLRACEALDEWERIDVLLPAARRQQALSDSELRRLEHEAALRRLNQGLLPGSADSLEATWSSLNKSVRQDAEVLQTYIDGLVASGQVDQAERLIRGQLVKEYDPQLVQRYGALPVAAPYKALAQVDKWLLDRPDDPALLQAAGRFALQAKLWGRARSYFEAAMARRPDDPASYHLLGILLEQMGELDAARERYRQALEHMGKNGGLQLSDAERQALAQVRVRAE